jgi:hypothetical protein
VVNVDTSVGGTGIARVQLTPTLGAHTIKLSWVSGNARVIGVGFWNSTISGFLPIAVAQGGINLWANAAQSYANWQTFLGWVTPDVITFEMKDSQVDAAAQPGYTGTPALTAFNSWLTAVKNASTVNAGPDVIIIGSTPASNNGPQLLMNKAQAALAATYQPGLNAFGWDGYTPLGDYANVLAMGWQNDGTHLDWKAQNFLASLLARDVGLLDLASQVEARDVNASTAILSTSVKVTGTTPSSPPLTLLAATPDIKLMSGRNIIIRRGDDSATVAQFSSTGGSDNILPQYSRIGDSAKPFLMGSDPQYLGVGQAGNLTQSRDIYLRSVIMQPGANAAASGSVSVDFTNAALWELTLTGNITALSFANVNGVAGWLIELHFIQDATGSRTLAGANASIKWAGGSSPTLTTTAGRRDVFQFRKLAGPIYVEVARSMNVG